MKWGLWDLSVCVCEVTFGIECVNEVYAVCLVFSYVIENWLR